MPHLRNIAFVALACCAVACDPPALSSGPILTKYGSAACIPFSAIQHSFPDHVREWDTPLTLRDGAQVTVKGIDSVSGNVTVFYPATGRVVVAADPNDYIYPSDVRLDAQNELLYVKAEGLAVLDGDQTWLFEFDFRKQRIMQRTRVRNGILPMECPEPPHSQ
jgi:hypothetical protein